MNYLTDIDPYAVKSLDFLISLGLISGMTERHDVRNLEAAKLSRYLQCHLFAGVGGWPLALKLAGWPENVSVWTGSCPCQPFSIAGKRVGLEDDRNLWPYFYRLIAECHPPTIFGEQVAGPLGREWVTRVFIDLEALGYAVAGADLCAAGVASPHIRQRLWWVADSNRSGFRKFQRRRTTQKEFAPSERNSLSSFWEDYTAIPFADGRSRRLEPGCEPLVNGFPSRIRQLRLYGNSLVPQVGAIFIRAFMESAIISS